MMKVLIYKRTHTGDPRQEGVFGCEDCMGRIRNWDYDAVIGIGGKSPDKGSEGIKHKVNWVGIGVKRIKSPAKRGDRVVFSHFALYEEKGIEINKVTFPNLFEYMYGTQKRNDMSSHLNKDVYEEVKKILDLVKDSPASKEYDIEDDNTLETSMNSKSSKCGGCSSDENIELTIQESEC